MYNLVVNNLLYGNIHWFVEVETQVSVCRKISIDMLLKYFFNFIVENAVVYYTKEIGAMKVTKYILRVA